MTGRLADRSGQLSEVMREMVSGAGSIGRTVSVECVLGIVVVLGFGELAALAPLLTDLVCSRSADGMQS